MCIAILDNVCWPDGLSFQPGILDVRAVIGEHHTQVDLYIVFYSRVAGALDVALGTTRHEQERYKYQYPLFHGNLLQAYYNKISELLSFLVLKFV